MRPTCVRLRVSLWLAAAACFAYICRSSIAVAEKTIRQEIGLSEEMMGFILGPAFFWPYALAQIPGGLFGQRAGSRIAVPVLSIAWSAATGLMACAFGPLMLLIGRITGGIAQAGLFPCSAVCLSNWFPRDERALASGSLGAAMSVGAAVGVALTGELLGLFSWRIVFLLFSIPGLIWAVGFWYWFRETPAEHPAVNSAELELISARAGTVVSPRHDFEPPESVDWAALATSVTMWQICGQQFFRAAGYAFFTSWFATYLQETRSVSTAASGWLLAVPLAATVGAALVGGTISDRLIRRTGRTWLARSGLASGALLACAGLVMCAWFVTDAAMATALIGAGAFCAGMAGPCAYATTIDFGGRTVAPVFATMNMIGNFGAGLLPWIVPRFRDWIQQSPQLLELAGGNSWNAVLLLFGSMYLLAASCWIALDPNRTLPSAGSEM